MNVGVITKDTAEAYHAVKALSNSGISRLLQTPAHFKAWRDGEAQKQTEAMAFGQMFHLKLWPGASSSLTARVTGNSRVRRKTMTPVHPRILTASTVFHFNPPTPTDRAGARGTP